MNRSLALFCSLAVLSLCLALGIAGCKRKSAAPTPGSVIVTAPPAPPEPWRIVSHQIGGAPAYLSNGFLGVRLSASGMGVDESGKPMPAFIRTAYKDGSLQIAPNLLAIKMKLGGEWLFPRAEGYEQVLDMRQGILRTQWTQQAGSASVKVSVETWLPKGDTSCAVMQVTLTSDRQTSLELDGSIDFSASPTFKLKSSATSNQFGTTDHLVEAETASNPPATEPYRFKLYTAIERTSAQASSEPANQPSVTLNAKEPFKLTRIAQVQRGLSVTPMPSYDDLLIGHTKAWDNLWQSDIEIEGDVAMQQRVRSWLFALYSSALENGSYSVPPMGLSSEVYSGHIFWDADIWMLPALLPLQPSLADDLVNYRLRSAPQAQTIAINRKEKGLRFPWEGDLTGKEVAPEKFQDEIHITGDVAWGIYNRAKWRDGVLKPEERDVIVQCAVWWANRVEKQPDGSYHLKKVISPDEGEYVDNDLYTNLLAKWNLSMGAKLANNPEWKAIADKIKLPFDQSKNFYAAFDNDPQTEYKQAVALLSIYPLGFPIPDDMKARMLDFYAAKTSKSGPAMAQAIDCIVACELGDSEKAYQSFVESFREFERAPLLGFSETRRSGRDRTYFCTGAGGCLQAILYGFAGIRLVSADDLWGWTPAQAGKRAVNEKIINGKTRLIIAPTLPKGWTRLTIKGLRCQNQAMTLVITPQTIEIQPLPESSK